LATRILVAKISAIHHCCEYRRLTAAVAPTHKRSNTKVTNHFCTAAPLQKRFASRSHGRRSSPGASMQHHGSQAVAAFSLGHDQQKSCRAGVPDNYRRKFARNGWILAVTICFTICLFISPDLDGHRAPKSGHVRSEFRCAKTWVCKGRRAAEQDAFLSLHRCTR
jgi:hypothetical protein